MAFHKAASARKMDLVLRGLPCANATIDDLFELKAKALPESAWDAFLREEFPSPRAAPSAAAAAAVAADNNGGASSRPMVKIADQIRRALHGDDDVDLDAILDTGAIFVEICDSFGGGPFSQLSVKEARTNLEKIECGIKEMQAKGASMRSLLKKEASSGIHSAGGVLKDPSAAMGLLWLMRFLAFWEEICLMRVSDAEHATPLSATVETAYKQQLLPYHGWVTQKAFEVALQAAPTWQSVRPYFAPTDEAFSADVAGFVGLSQSLQGRVMAALRELDLVDVRTTV